MSVLGFQSGSYITIRLAPTKFTPSPPTRVVNKNTNNFGSYKTQQYTATRRPQKQFGIENRKLHASMPQKVQNIWKSSANALQLYDVFM